MEKIRKLIVLVLLATPGTCVWALSGPDHGKISGAWECKAFQTSGKDVLAAVRRIPAKGGAVGCQVLLEERRALVRPDGQIEFIDRTTLRILTREAMNGLKRILADWKPWCEEKPTIRARVIGTDGTEHALDPDTIVETRPQGGTAPAPGEECVLQAPLPALEVGCVIEFEIRKLIREAFPGCGWSVSSCMGNPAPTLCSQFVWERPPSVPVRCIFQNLGRIVPREENRDGKVLSLIELRDLPGWEDPIPCAPPEYSPRAMVSLVPPLTWKSVAESYAAVVEDGIARSKLPEGILVQRGKEASRFEMIRDVLEYITGSIHSTGIAFGAASPAPAGPGEVILRQYGDGKDLSTLMVALLRKRGIQAHLALVVSGNGPDVDPAAPGISAFNRAIVQIEGDKPLWVDPASRSCPLGQIPASCQGRMALVIAPGTHALVRIPEALPQANSFRVMREYRLVETGSAHLLETAEYTGANEEEIRTEYASTTAMEIIKHLQEYANGFYLAESSPTIEYTDPRDLRKPFRIRMEIARAKAGLSIHSTAVVSLPLQDLEEQMPEILKPLSSGNAEEGDGEPAAETVRDFLLDRKEDVCLPFPMNCEWRILVVPASGMVPMPPPEDVHFERGGCRLSLEFQKQPEGNVKAEFSLQLPRRMSAEDARQFRAGFAELESKDFSLTFVPKGEALLEEGKIPEAVRECRSLLALNPESADHHQLLARALLAAGLGEEARREAGRAVQLEPDSVQAHKTLGLVLAHDSFGRYLKPGFNRNGSASAFRRALELNPEDDEARVGLASLLEYDVDGVRFASPEGMEEAAREHGKLRKGAEGEARLQEYLLLRLGKYEEVIALTSTPREDPELEKSRKQYRTTAWALLKGVPSAVKEASVLMKSPEERQALLLLAADQCRCLRKFRQAAEFYEAGAVGSESASALRSMADLFRNLRPPEQMPAMSDSPEGAARKFEGILMCRNLDWRALEDALAEEARPCLKNPIVRKCMERFHHDLAARIDEMGADPMLFRDMYFSGAKAVVEGSDETGYRVTLELGDSSMKNGIPHFVVKENGYRVLAFMVAEILDGNTLVSLLDAGKERLVRSCLDWVSENVFSESRDDLFAGDLFQSVWKKGREKNRQVLELAILLQGSRNCSREQARLYLPLFERFLSSEVLTGEMADRLRMEYCLNLLRAGEKGKAEVLALSLRDRYPQSRGALDMLMTVLCLEKKWELSRQYGQKWMENNPEDKSVCLAMAGSYALEGRYRDAVDLLKKNAPSGTVKGWFSELAWFELLQGQRDEEVLRMARKGCTEEKDAEGTSLCTLAVASAVLGNVCEARDLLHKILDTMSDGKPTSSEWLVIGRIAECCGEKETARAAYLKVKDEGEEEEILSVRRTDLRLLAHTLNWVLARRWMAAMDAASSMH